jgi:hypothetical protein
MILRDQNEQAIGFLRKGKNAMWYWRARNSTKVKIFTTKVNGKDPTKTMIISQRGKE